ncbi:PAS domain-containing protein, partial [Haematococcus lacustris]
MQTVQRMFGYTKSEIKGKNINCIIPPPFSENHNSFVRNYVTLGKCLDPTAAAPDLDLDHFPLRRPHAAWYEQGKETLIGKHNEFVALHKERHVFGVTLHVTKISGIGEDMLFLGVVQALSSEPGMARVWVMLGSEAVVCVDPAFTDMSGFRSEELLGSQLEDWLLQPEPIA